MPIHVKSYNNKSTNGSIKRMGRKLPKVKHVWLINLAYWVNKFV